MNKQQLADQLKTSMGQKKAELVLKNAKIVNVFTHEIEEGNIAIENGMIAEVKPSEDPRDEQEDEIRDEREDGRETRRTADVPDEFSTRLAALEASVSNLVAQFSRATPKPNQAGSGMPNKGKTQLSKEAVSEAAKRFYNK